MHRSVRLPGLLVSFALVAACSFAREPRASRIGDAELDAPGSRSERASDGQEKKSAAQDAAMDEAVPAAVQACPPAPSNEPRALSMNELVATLQQHIESWAPARYRDEAAAFHTEHSLTPNEKTLRDYVVMRALLELTRDGGAWGIRWAITNKEPTSKEIWSEWSRKAPTIATSRKGTAVAECDEISAIYAFLARNMKVESVGLFYPTWNHAIAAWEPEPKKRVLIPTSQIFLGCEATFDRTTFDPLAQKRLMPFPLHDVKGATRLPPALVAFLLDRADAYGPASNDVQVLLRLLRGTRAPSSHSPGCTRSIHELAKAIASTKWTCVDRVALTKFAIEEAGERSAEELLAR